MPAVRRRPAPFHLAHLAGHEELKNGGVPEFSQAMEKEEASRLQQAKRSVHLEQEKWKDILADKERELEGLQKLLSG